MPFHGQERHALIARMARFALAVNSVWCTLMYSTGMPVLNLVALLYFVICYYADRSASPGGGLQAPSHRSQEL